MTSVLRWPRAKLSSVTVRHHLCEQPLHSFPPAEPIDTALRVAPLEGAQMTHMATCERQSLGTHQLLVTRSKGRLSSQLSQHIRQQSDSVVPCHSAARPTEASAPCPLSPCVLGIKPKEAAPPGPGHPRRPGPVPAQAPRVALALAVPGGRAGGQGWLRELENRRRRPRARPGGAGNAGPRKFAAAAAYTTTAGPAAAQTATLPAPGCWGASGQLELRSMRPRRPVRRRRLRRH